MVTQLTATPKLYIGMDIHKKSWSVHMRTDISDHKSFTTPPDCAVLYNYVASHFPGYQVSLTYEAGCCGFSAARYFLNLGWEVLVVNPSDIPRMDKQQYQKTDAIDCRNLSKQLKADQLKGIYVPGEDQDQLKSLLRQRAEITKQLRSVKAQIKSLLLYHGHQIPAQFDNPNWNKNFIQWLSSIKWTYEPGNACMESKLRIYEVIHKEHLQLANLLRSYYRKHYKKDYYLLKSIPGIGGYLSSAILAELGDLRRFGSETELASYIGIVPVIQNSGAKETMQRVTPRCRALLRSYIIESAWVALRLDPAMQNYYRKHLGKNPKSIIVKIARKLINRMLSVIKNETPYQLNTTKEQAKKQPIKNKK
ncbi:MAG: IS110 family transposase [Nitrosopumilus sp.]|nr:IS110 family transposase [Nitrosopumilus sp.]